MRNSNMNVLIMCYKISPKENPMSASRKKVSAKKEINKLFNRNDAVFVPVIDEVAVIAYPLQPQVVETFTTYSVCEKPVLSSAKQAISIKNY